MKKLLRIIIKIIKILAIIVYAPIHFWATYDIDKMNDNIKDIFK